MLRSVLWLGGFVVALYLAVCVLAFVFQRRLMYHPTRFPEGAALVAAKRLGLTPWRDVRGALAGWRRSPESPPRARALVLSGNAGCALDRADYAAALAGLGVETVLLEYPGYGARPGAPSRASIGRAAVDALDALAAEGPEPIWILGESLGSGVAGRAVALRPGLVKALLLLTPYARMREVAALHYPYLPSWLVRDRWAPADELAGFRGPAYVVLAGRDRTVGLAQGRALVDRLPGPKRVVLQEGASHSGLDLGPELWRDAVEFLSGDGR